MSIARAIAALENMPLSRLDEITGMGATLSGAQGPRIVDAVRDAVLYGHRYHAWDNPSDVEEGIHNAADFLVPTNPAHRLGEFAEIGAVLETDPAEFDDFTATEWRNNDLPDAGQITVAVFVGRVLYLVYSDAVRKTVSWLYEQVEVTS